MNQFELEFFREIDSLIKPVPKLTIEYRLYYDDTGWIYQGVSHNHPPDTNYVVVTQEQYDNPSRYRVIKGQLVDIQEKIVYRLSRLVPSESGFVSVRNHASLIVEPAEEYTDIQYYDYRDN